MYTTHSVLNRSMWPRKRGTIVNVSSVTGLECPPFNGEAVYHANKACVEGFTNSLRMETAGSNIRVLALRPGCVVSHFHLQRVKYDKDAMDEFFYGYEPLLSEDLADAVWYMVSCPERISIKALDCVPTAQRSLTRFDREWNARRDENNRTERWHSLWNLRCVVRGNRSIVRFWELDTSEEWKRNSIKGICWDLCHVLHPQPFSSLGLLLPFLSIE